MGEVEDAEGAALRDLLRDLVDEEVAGEAEVCERGAGGRRGVGERRWDFEGT